MSVCKHDKKMHDLFAADFFTSIITESVDTTSDLYFLELSGLSCKQDLEVDILPVEINAGKIHRIQKLIDFFL